MTHKAVLQNIAAMPKNGDYEKLYLTVIIMAQQALVAVNAKGELAKQEKDREKANAAIKVLLRVLGDMREPYYVREAVAMELTRMRKAFDDPAALKKIYRRYEK
jgi:hypothetical protein